MDIKLKIKRKGDGLIENPYSFYKYPQHNYYKISF